MIFGLQGSGVELVVVPTFPGRLGFRVWGCIVGSLQRLGKEQVS